MAGISTGSGWPRRRFLQQAAAFGGSAIATSLWASRGMGQAPAVIASDRMRPRIPNGVMSGDISQAGAVIWSRGVPARPDRVSRMIVEYALDDSFRQVQRVVGDLAVPRRDFTARVFLPQLPPDRTVFYRVRFEDLDDPKLVSEPVQGQLKTAPRGDRGIRFVWGGDTAGQGWGINPDLGGMRIYETMRQLQPDFFIHSGDTIYADNPLQAEVKLDDGSLWRNLTTPAKSKVAETLEEFRGNFLYNLLDDNVRRFNAEVPQLTQWDDHEVINNWYPGEILTDDRYTVKDATLLAQRAKQAFLEYSPIHFDRRDPQRIYRSFQYGPALEVLMLDERSYRGANSANRQPVMSAATEWMGREQIRWLKQQLQRSRATWKVIASDMPVGLMVGNSTSGFDNAANGDGPALGRELEIADLLQWIKRQNIRNVVWLTADVHYAAAHYYNPNRAQFQDFLPFWEFVAGPLNAGTFGPNPLDNTFGPEVKFQSVKPGEKMNRSPKEGFQFFGVVEIDGASRVMTVSLKNLAGKTLYSIDLKPEGV